MRPLVQHGWVVMDGSRVAGGSCRTVANLRCTDLTVEMQEFKTQLKRR